MRAKKTLRLPRPKELQSNKLEDIQNHFRLYYEALDKAWRSMFADLIYDEDKFTSTKWRLIEDGENMLVQKKIGGTWTTIGTWSE